MEVEGSFAVCCLEEKDRASTGRGGRGGGGGGGRV